jgi:transcriptional regulator with XRE-family HTH domain
MLFGQKLRALRREQQRTLKDVSDSARMSVGYLSKIETGTNNPPTVKLIRRLCFALGCETELPALVKLARVSSVPPAGADGFQGMHFGKRLRELRHERGCTLQAVSDAVRVSPTYLVEIELGKINPPDSSLIKKLCSALECDAELSELVDLAKRSHVREPFVLRTTLYTPPEVREMIGLLRQSHVAGKISPASALAIVSILRGDTTTP